MFHSLEFATLSVVDHDTSNITCRYLPAFTPVGYQIILFGNRGTMV